MEGVVDDVRDGVTTTVALAVREDVGEPAMVLEGVRRLVNVGAPVPVALLVAPLVREAVIAAVAVPVDEMEVEGAGSLELYGGIATPRKYVCEAAVAKISTAYVLLVTRNTVLFVHAYTK